MSSRGGVSLSGLQGVRRAVRRLRRHLEARVIVLMYHRVADLSCDPWDQCVTKQHFREQLEVLQRHVEVIPLSRVSRALQDGTLPRRAVALTFDDGYADNLITARPLLEKYGIPATFFITSGALARNREFWWDELERLLLHPGRLPETLELTISGVRHAWGFNSEAIYDIAAWTRHRAWRALDPPETTRQRVYLDIWRLLRPLPAETQDQTLTELATWAGDTREPRATHRALTPAEAQQLPGHLFELGAHTVSHAALSTRSREVQEHEVCESKKSIEALVNQPVLHFAYPYGDHSADTMDVVRRNGFEAAFTARPRSVDPRGLRWQLPRFKVDDWNGEEFSRRLAAMFSS